MTVDPFNALEQQLRDCVSERRSLRRNRWRAFRAGRSWHVFLTIVAAGGVTTGALAATGNLPILRSGDREADPNYMVLTVPGMSLTATTKPTLLPLRVKDPRGGPPWALRTFPIERGRLCAQAGQLYNGRFGVVTQTVNRKIAPGPNGPAPAKTGFQELAPAVIPGVRCGAARAGDQLIAANRTSTIISPDGTDLRCRNSPPPRGVAPCPITAVTVVRWGFLGPRAKTATFLQPGDHRGPTQQLDRRTGGAYLFAESVDPKPFRESQSFERSVREQLRKQFPELESGTDREREPRIPSERMREFRAYARSLAEQARPQRRANWRAQQAEAVDATFAGAAPRRVAGPGAKGGPLPGVAPVIASIPKVGPAKISARFRGRLRAVEIRFAAPAALDARPGAYVVSARGPLDGACGKADSSQAEYARETAAREVVLVRLRPVQLIRQRGRPSWCPGARYEVQVRHVVRNANKPGLRSAQVVGKTTFKAR
jgi:hypothetical protein